MDYYIDLKQRLTQLPGFRQWEAGREVKAGIPFPIKHRLKRFRVSLRETLTLLDELLQEADP